MELFLQDVLNTYQNNMVAIPRLAPGYLLDSIQFLYIFFINISQIK